MLCVHHVCFLNFTSQRRLNEAKVLFFRVFTRNIKKIADETTNISAGGPALGCLQRSVNRVAEVHTRAETGGKTLTGNSETVTCAE